VAEPVNRSETWSAYNLHECDFPASLGNTVEALAVCLNPVQVFEE
jgi:hypothetical protein